MKQRKKRKIIYNAFFTLMLAIMIFSGFMIGKDWLLRKKEREKFQALKELIVVEDEKQIQSAEHGSGTENETMDSGRDLLKLVELNCECMGWIYIPDTKVDYPVMHTPDEPQKYLRKNFYEEDSVAGVPFLDSRCVANSDNLIIYGHNMKDKTMFGSLKNYIDSAYGMEHRNMEFETASGCDRYVIFSVMMTDTSDGWYDFVSADTREEFEEYVKIAKDKSIYDFEMPLEYEKQLITLSTCYGLNSDKRLLVVACKVGEDG
ncbi:MAG: class B sortase [Lachnospiraceae bacterium]|nr:class B sortase [Lachnospiraceae bacterium]